MALLSRSVAVGYGGAYPYHSNRKLRGGDKLAPAPANSLDHTMIQKLRTLFMHQKKSFHVYQKSEQFIPEIHVQIQPIAPTELYILISGIRREHDIPFALGFPLKPFFFLL